MVAAALNVVLSLDALDRARIRAELEGLVENWRDLFVEHAAKTRQILQKLLTKRIRFVPEARDGVRGYPLEAEGTVRSLLAEVVRVVASPEGSAPFSENHGKGVTSLMPPASLSRTSGGACVS